MFTNPQALDTVRVLIIENELLQAEGIRDGLLAISSEDKRKYGALLFEIRLAHSVTESVKLLNEARDKKAPYHLVFLDLGLPINNGEPERSPEDTGLKVLEHARLSGATMQIIIVSKFPLFEYARAAFLGGALDFIAKPYTLKTLQDQTKDCLKRLQAKYADALLEQRLRDLFPYDEQVLAYRFGACFSGLTQDVVYETEQLEEEFRERLDLDAKTDSQDSLVRHLEALSVAVRKSKQAWADLQEMLPKGGEEPTRYVVAELLREIETELLPCLKVKQVELDIPSGQPVEVLSFYEDTRVVLRELILGGLCKLTNYGEPERKLEISISTFTESEYAKVTFSSDLFHFDEPTKAAIAKGQRQNDGQFGQVWGLSVAQHIALRGGGRLQIGSAEQPDSVTYFIPLARHA
ncbi:MAG: response regulator [Acidobacteria bacterium]|nr:response regulator [Acidobacteriota bacterium]MBI3421335.1 response regulator [Acidobacteriota bacterium]